MMPGLPWSMDSMFFFEGDHFPADEIFNPFDHRGKTVVWSAFQNLLTKLFKKHFVTKVDKDDIKQMYQILSVFSQVNCANLLSVKGTFGDPVQFAIPDQSAFVTIKLEYKEEEDSKGSILMNKFLLFVPAFIWAFNELKKALLEDDNHLHVVYNDINLHKGITASNGGSPGPPINPPTIINTAYFFDSGTGVNVRKDDFWLQYFNLRLLELAAVEEAKRRGERTGMAPLLEDSNIVGVPNMPQSRVHGPSRAH